MLPLLAAHCCPWLLPLPGCCVLLPGCCLCLQQGERAATRTHFGAAPDQAMRLLTACIVATALSAGTAKKKKRRRPRDDPRAAAFAAAAGGAARALAAAADAAGPPEAAAASGPPPELAGHVATPLLAGCTHAFLDLGANAGVQTRKLHQPKLYVRSSFVPLFQKAGFYKDGVVRCAIGVEPAREYWPRLRELATRLTNRNMRTTFVLGGVGRCGNQPVLRVTRPCWLRRVVMNAHRHRRRQRHRLLRGRTPDGPHPWIHRRGPVRQRHGRHAGLGYC